MSNKQRNDRSGNSRSGSKPNLKDRPVVKDKMAEGGQRTKEIVNVNSDSDSLLREMDSDTDGIGTQNSTKDTERHNQRKQIEREKEKYKQREKRKRLSTGESTGESSEQYKLFSNDEKLSLILTKLSENEIRFKSLEEKLDTAIDQNKLGAFELTIVST